jgi:1-acyl-sn-glycerol-3-phosphate acyltransferase
MIIWLYDSVRLIVRILLFLLTSWQVNGNENIPKQGALIIVANHLNLADPFLLGASINRRVVFLAKEELFHNPLSRYVVSSLGAIPVYRGQMARGVLHQTVQILAHDQALALFPEGARSRSGQMKRAFPGAALIASRSRVPVLPVGISGTEKIRGVAWFLHRPRITMNIGHPFYLEEGSDKRTTKELTEYTDSIMRNIAELLPLEYRGYYSYNG